MKVKIQGKFLKASKTPSLALVQQNGSNKSEGKI
jgi:hypothetical protein